MSETFLSILASNENYEAVAKEILELIFFMMKMNQPIVIPLQEIAKACLNYTHNLQTLLDLDASNQQAGNSCETSLVG